MPLPQLFAHILLRDYSDSSNNGTSSDSNHIDTNGGVHGGLVLGLAIGLTIFVVLLFLVALVFCRRRATSGWGRFRAVHSTSMGRRSDGPAERTTARPTERTTNRTAAMEPKRWSRGWPWPTHGNEHVHGDGDGDERRGPDEGAKQAEFRPYPSSQPPMYTSGAPEVR